MAKQTYLNKPILYRGLCSVEKFVLWDGDNMEILAIYDRKDYDLSFPYYVRNAVKAIIIVENKIALIHNKKYDVFVFPGGGIENGETDVDALIRETKEEAGLIIKPSSILEFGKIVEIRKDRKADGIYERHDYFYLCEVEDKSILLNLSKNEIENGHRFVYIPIDEAIKVNETHIRQGYNWTEGIVFVLNHLKITKTAG